MPTGYSSYPTIFKIGGVPVAAARMDTFPKVSMGTLDTTALGDVWDTSIPDGKLVSGTFDVKLKTAPAIRATMLAYIAAKTIVDGEFDFADGDALYMDAAHPVAGIPGGVIITAMDAGGANADGPALEELTISLKPSGPLVYAAVGLWYTPITTLSIEGGNFPLVTPGTLTKQLKVWASAGNGFQFQPSIADITLASATPAKATLSATALATWVAAGGTSIMSAQITAKPAVTTNVLCTTT